MIDSLVAFLARLVTGVRLLPEPPCPGQPCIYFANHASHLDFVVIWASLPAADRRRLSPAAAEDYWGKTALRRKVACGFFHAVLIPREGITRENHPIDRLSAALEEGRSLLVFPEGTRSGDGTIGAFRPGLHHLASRFPEVPLVPVYLENLNRILPKGTLLPVPVIAQTHFRAPLHLEPGETKAAFLERARTCLLDDPKEKESPLHG
jgi:1-acyl-sn-glycerol-3-phosphate acyltransferase